MSAWIGSIINHFCWCCASCEGNSILLKEKWISVLYYILNNHAWEDATVYQLWHHAKPTKRDRLDTVWLVEGSPAHVALEDIIKSKFLLKDLVYLTDFSHTGGIEVSNSLHNKFWPKRLHFGWYGMVARTELAVLDFNSDSLWVQAASQETKNLFKLSFSKVTQSWDVQKISRKKNKKNIEELMEQTIRISKSKLQTDALTIKCLQIFGLRS